MFIHIGGGIAWLVTYAAVGFGRQFCYDGQTDDLVFNVVNYIVAGAWLAVLLLILVLRATRRRGALVATVGWLLAAATALAIAATVIAAPECVYE